MLHYIKSSGRVWAGFLASATLFAPTVSAAEGKLDWPQFRGPSGCARAERAGPVEFGPEHIQHFIDWQRSELYEVVRGEGECAV